MRALRFIAVLLIPAALLVLPATNATVQTEPQLAADEANVAATTDATWTPGSVDLEGVSHLLSSPSRIKLRKIRPPKPVRQLQMFRVSNQRSVRPRPLALTMRPTVSYRKVTRRKTVSIRCQAHSCRTKRPSKKSMRSATDSDPSTTPNHAGNATRIQSPALSARSRSCGPDLPQTIPSLTRPAARSLITAASRRKTTTTRT